MSKSLNNFISIDEFLKNNPPELLRFLVLNHHYRSPVNYTDKLNKEMLASLNSLKEFMAKINFLKKFSKTKSDGNLNKKIKTTEKLFNAALQNDFKTNEALALIFRLIAEINKSIWQLSKSDVAALEKRLNIWLKSLGLTLNIEKIPLNIQKLARERELFRENKQFIRSDALRKKIKQLGYEVEDTSLGPFIKRLRYSIDI